MFHIAYDLASSARLRVNFPDPLYPYLTIGTENLQRVHNTYVLA
jgi:hypothetical protein